MPERSMICLVNVIASIFIASACQPAEPPASGRGNDQSGQIGIQSSLTHSIPLANTPAMDAASKPVPLPRPGTADVAPREPMDSFLRSVDLTQGEDIEIDTAIDGGDGKKFQKSDEALSRWPSNAIGKILSDGGSCSGSAIGPHLVLSAGHCVHPGNSAAGGYGNVRFQPGYPLHGTWYLASEVFVHRGWVNGGAFQWDYSIIYFANPLPLTAYWGIIAGVDWGKARQCSPGEQNCRRSAVFSYGYPAAAPFTGRFQFYDPVAHSCWYCSSGRLVFKIVGMDYWDLAPGASGGPWMDLRPVGGTVFPPPIGDRNNSVIAGINSFMFRDNPGEIWSPQFTTASDDIQAMYREIVQTRPR